MTARARARVSQSRAELYARARCGAAIRGGARWLTGAEEGGRARADPNHGEDDPLDDVALACLLLRLVLTEVPVELVLAVLEVQALVALHQFLLGARQREGGGISSRRLGLGVAAPARAPARTHGARRDGCACVPARPG